MKRVLFSRISGKTISINCYRILSHLIICAPLVMTMISGCLIQEDARMRLIKILFTCFIVTVCLLSSNRIFFGFEEDAFLIMNVMGYVKRAIKLNEITSLAVVGAAMMNMAPGANQRLGYKDKHGKFVYYPYLLIYKSHVDVKREGDDVRSYGGYEYGFTMIHANLQVWNVILKGTKCPVYFDARIAQENYRLYESCQNESRVEIMT